MDRDSVLSELMYSFDRALKVNELFMYIETPPPLQSSLT